MDEKDDLGCLIIAVVIVIAIALFALLIQKGSCYDAHTKYEYETRYSIMDGCEMSIEDKWISIEGGRIAIDGIKEYLP